MKNHQKRHGSTTRLSVSDGHLVIHKWRWK